MKKHAAPNMSDGLQHLTLSSEELEQLSPEGKHALSVLNQICAADHKTKAEDLLKDYEESIPDDLQSTFDPQASLDAFRNRHKALLDSPPEAPQKHPSIRRRLFTLIVAVLLIASFVITAFGHNPYNMIVQWGKETFRFGSDFKIKDDIIYYDDGTYEDRSGMGLTAEESDEIVRYIEDNDLTPEEAKEYIQTLMEEGTYDKDPPPEPEGELLEPLPVDPSETIETIPEQGTIFEVMEKYGVHKKIFPTWIPDGFEQTSVSAVVDHRDNSIDFSVTYEKGDSFLAFHTTHILPGQTVISTEKDSRPVEKYTCGGLDYYLMYNLSQVNATAMTEDTQIFFNGDVTKEEMKKMIDSIYEGVEK